MRITRSAPARDATAPAGGGPGQYFYLLGTHFFRLFLLNLLTLACCLPLVTIPAALTAASRSLMSLLMGNSALFWEEYRAEFRERFLGKLGCWLLLMAAPVALGFWSRVLGLSPRAAEAVLLAGLALSLLVQGYFFSFVPLVRLPLGVCLRNAALLLLLEWKTTLGMLLVFALSAVLLYGLYPYSLIVVFFLFFSGMLLFVCQRCLAAFRRNGLLLEEGKAPANQEEETA